MLTDCTVPDNYNYFGFHIVMSVLYVLDHFLASVSDDKRFHHCHFQQNFDLATEDNHFDERTFGD